MKALIILLAFIVLIGSAHAGFRPIIGIAGFVDVPGKRNTVGQYRISRTYSDAIVEAGGIAVHLIPMDKKGTERILNRLDGLMMGAGPDINPKKYGEEASKNVHPMCPERQKFDFTLLKAAMEKKMPVLGICLGSQMINVIRGGTLVQDIPTQLGKEVLHQPRDIKELDGGMHPIHLVKGTKLRKIYDKKQLQVNSNHHQALKRLGKGLVISARSKKDQVVEGIEDPKLPFLVGVQFQPQRQNNPKDIHLPLFKAFVKSAQEYRKAEDAKRMPKKRKRPGNFDENAGKNYKSRWSRKRNNK